MQLKKLLRLQLFYYFLGILFNAVSFYLIQQGGGGLTPNDPILGSIVMTIYAIFLLSGFFQKITLYRGLMVLAVLVLGYGGVANHLNFMRETPELYHSTVAGLIGVGINIFGFILNGIAVLGKFKLSE